MEVERWRRIDELLAAALEFAEVERAAFLEQACGNDLDLRREVDSLLAHDGASETFIENSALGLAAEILANDERDPDRVSWEGRRVGAYQIVRKIGRGGMGAVFLAERVGDEFQQQVALKVVRRSLADPALSRRFRRERQILASLNHPNIAHLIDGGVSEDGEPFFAMEYVEGTRIDDYCDEHDLTTEQRLKIFLSVCSGVIYAHRHLVVHRDLKPSNILISKDGSPKLLDFGIAKLLDTEENAEHTQTASRAFTLEYAAPEQLQGQNVSTAADIYSLGVILYELLTHTRPHKFKSASAEEIARAIQLEPARPSAVSKNSRASTNKSSGKRTTSNSRKLEGDIDNIVLMALRQEPERRYSSVEQFASDIQRYLDRRPVLARPNTVWYRTSKFVRRNRVAISAAALVLLTLVVGLSVTVRQYRNTQRVRMREEAVNGYLKKMLLSSNPSFKGASNSNPTIKDVLDAASSELESEELANQPEVKAQLQHIIGTAYLAQGRYEEGEKLVSAAVEAETKLYGADDPITLDSRLALIQLKVTKADYDGAEPLYRQILPVLREKVRARTISPALLQFALNGFAVLRRAEGDSKEAEQLLREVVSLRGSLPPDAHGLTRQSQTVLVLTLLDQGKFADAELFARQLVDEFRHMPDANTPEMCGALTILGSVLMERNDLAGAESNLREAEVLYRKNYDSNYVPIYDNLRLQAQNLYLQGRLTEAASLIEKVLENYKQNSNPRYISFATALTIKGLILNKEGRADEAEKILREALALRETNLPSNHFMTALTRGALGECLTTLKKFDDAESALIASYDSLVLSHTIDNPRTTLAKQRLIALYSNWGKTGMLSRYR